MHAVRRQGVPVEPIIGMETYGLLTWRGEQGCVVHAVNFG